METATRIGDSLLVVLAIVVIWQLLYMAVGEFALSGPIETFYYLFEQLMKPSFWPHIAATIRAFAYALVISILLGLGIGIWLGAHRLSGEVGEPVLVALYSLPKITLYPVILMVFGLGLSARIAFGAIHGFIPIAIFTMNALSNLRPVYLRAAKSMHLSSRQIVFTVMLPAALPEITSGIRIGFSLTLLGVIIGEMFASKEGLGYLIVHAIEFADTRMMLAVTILLFTFATVANALLLRLDNLLHRR